MNGTFLSARPDPSSSRADGPANPAPHEATLPGELALVSNDRIEVVSRGRATMIASTYVDKPRWSPDGTKLAFLDSNRSVAVLSYPDYHLVAEVTVEGDVIDYEWAPDSDHLALVAPVIDCALIYCYPQPETGLWVTALSDPTLHRIDVAGTSPTWSPDSQHLAYHVGWDVHVASRTGDDSWLLHRFDGKTAVFEIEWGPSSEWIAAVVGRAAGEGAPQLGLLPVRHEEITVDDMVLWEREIAGPTDIEWGPDGSIAVGSMRGALLTAGVGQPLEPLGPERSAFNLTWSPDGRWLAYDTGSVVEAVSTTRSGGSVDITPGEQPHWRHA